jgi:hypothetical protein
MTVANEPSPKLRKQPDVQRTLHKIHIATSINASILNVQCKNAFYDHKVTFKLKRKRCDSAFAKRDNETHMRQP